MSISLSIKTKLPCLFFLLLISLTSSHAWYRKRLLCFQHCRTQQQEDWRQCEKHIGGSDGTELARCQRQTQDEEQRCEQYCQRKADKEVHESFLKPEEESIYKFYTERYACPLSTQDGYVISLRFDTRSELLEGLRNNRITLTRASPATFMIPSHRNADSIAIVTNGRGSITIIQEDNTETYNAGVGDIVRIPAGSVVHFVNTHSDINLFYLHEISVNTPSHFEPFFAPSSRDQESLFSAFGNEILRAAFNLDKDQVRKLFQGRNESAFVKASHEQIKALVQSGDQQSHSSKPYNIFNKRPSVSNKYGEMYEVYPQDYPPIQDLDVKVTYTNITRGGMFGPYYNTRSTTIATVVHGRGYVQMVSPQIQAQGSSYQKVRAKFVNGDYFIVPAGYPFVIVALEAKNLQVVLFEVKAHNNHRVALAGENNILKQLEKEAKELSFNISSKQVDDILSKQQRSWFFPAPQQHI